MAKKKKLKEGSKAEEKSESKAFERKEIAKGIDKPKKKRKKFVRRNNAWRK